MPRLPRLSLPGIPQHAIQRGNNRNACFLENPDYAVYLDKLKEYSQKYAVQVHSYVLMTNHVHLLLTPSDANGISRLFQSLGRYYVRYFNQTYQRSGTLWEGRFRSTLIESELYFLTVSRYIELNPVRAKMVTHPDQYPWSSYHRNANGKKIELIHPHACYLSLGNSDNERQTAYQALFKQVISDNTLNDIRNSVNKAWALGTSSFQQLIEQRAGRTASVRVHGGDRKSKHFKQSKQNKS